MLTKQTCNPFIRTFFFKGGNGGEIDDNSILLSKLEQIGAETLLGNYDPTTGNVKAVSVGDGLKFVGNTLETDITIDGWDGEVNTRNDLPITVGDPSVGSVYLVLQPVSDTILGVTYKTYQSGLYLRSFNTGALSDWERLNVKTQFTDAEFKVVDADNTSRQAKFDVGGITNGTTRTLSVQDKDITIAGIDDITVTGAENIGTEGEELFKQIANKLIQIKKIVGKGDVNITSNVVNDTIEVELTIPTTNWGDIQGTLSNQTDLQNALDTKLEGATNIGTEGIGIFKQVTNKLNELKKIVGKGDINITENVANNTIEIELTIPTVTVSWGDIQGTLANQTDLQNALDAKIEGATNIGTEGIGIFKQVTNKLSELKKIVGKGGTTVSENNTNNTIEIASPTIVPASIGRLQTTFAGDINTVTQTIVPFNILAINDNNDFEIGVNGGIVTKRPGSVELFGKLAFNDGGGNRQRLKLSIQFALDGVPVGVASEDSYLRDSSGAITSETKLREFFANVPANTEITILCVRNSSVTGASNVITANTYFDCIIRSSVQLNTPTIEDPIENQIIEFFEAVPSSYQSVGQGQIPLWELSGLNSEFTIDNGGLISYTGGGVTGDFSETVTATNSSGSDSVNFTLRVLSNPLNITGYAGHYRAEDLILSDGNSVPTISDISGNSRPLSQVSSTSQPIFRTNYGGYEAIVFDGLDDRLFINGIFIPSVTQCFFTVLRTSSTLLNRVVLGLSDIGNTGTVIVNDGGLGNLGATFNGSNPSGLNNSVNVNDNNWHVVMARHSGVSTEIAIDGGTPVIVAGAIAGSNITTFALGSIGFGGSFYEGGVSEAVIYTQNPTNTEVDDITNFLKSKYGI